MTTNKVIQIPFMGRTIFQHTDGGLVDISQIVDMVNERRALVGKENIQINDYFKSEDSQIYLDALLTKMNMKSRIREIPDTRNEEQNQVVTVVEEQEKITIKELKELKLAKTGGNRHSKTACFTPLLAIDIVGWLDPEIRLYFNAIVMKELFKQRVLISDAALATSDAIHNCIGKQENVWWMQYNYEINRKIIGSSYPGIRNEMDDAEYKVMLKLLDRIQGMAEVSMFKSREDVIDYIRRAKIK